MIVYLPAVFCAVSRETSLPLYTSLKSGRPRYLAVIGSSGLTCDACSTALFVMGKEKALTYCRNHPELEAVLVDEDGNVFVTEEIAESLSWNGDRNMKIIKRTENQ